MKNINPISNIQVQALFRLFGKSGVYHKNWIFDRFAAAIEDDVRSEEISFNPATENSKRNHIGKNILGKNYICHHKAALHDLESLLVDGSSLTKISHINSHIMEGYCLSYYSCSKLS